MGALLVLVPLALLVGVVVLALVAAVRDHRRGNRRPRDIVACSIGVVGSLAAVYVVAALLAAP